ncbi:hypothetical protein Pcinc_036050 [Petrolisthes cinctipes]|uniref:Uncharacterized protein n=1 Tax=Petrolisthes cinctipes TaxID=88211 RepID=A0AAE1BVQ6_PETCI|nr:hypothetical protein Pcinc_036050 [Petrolisthes cinctipes]
MFVVILVALSGLVKAGYPHPHGGSYGHALPSTSYRGRSMSYGTPSMMYGSHAPKDVDHYVTQPYGDKDKGFDALGAITQSCSELLWGAKGALSLAGYYAYNAFKGFKKYGKKYLKKHIKEGLKDLKYHVKKGVIEMGDYAIEEAKHGAQKGFREMFSGCTFIPSLVIG